MAGTFASSAHVFFINMFILGLEPTTFVLLAQCFNWATVILDNIRNDQFQSQFQCIKLYFAYKNHSLPPPHNSLLVLIHSVLHNLRSRITFHPFIYYICLHFVKNSQMNISSNPYDYRTFVTSLLCHCEAVFNECRFNIITVLGE